MQHTTENYQKALTLVKKARQEIEDLRRARNPSIAIIGMSCHLPGDCHSLDAFWQLLSQGKHGIRQVGDMRKAEFDAFNAKFEAGFIEGIDQFDAGFFGLSPKEARMMDPQQRLFLHLAFNAIQNAGLTELELKNSRTGVYVGANSNDYLQNIFQREASDEHTVMGNALSIIANRLSYFLDLKGPSMVIDTACSSSMVALHQASQALKAGDIDMALVGGISLISSADNTRSHQQGLPISSDFRCFTFDERANGYVRGEGCGVLVLKRLPDAIQAKDRIWALVMGSAVNQDGRTNGITAPNGLSQESVIKEALRNAAVDGDTIALIEAHGTGTALGDPIEVGALKSAYGKDQLVHLGAVKTNLGHLEAASGVVGVIKLALCLAHKTIVPNHDFGKLNPLIDFGSHHFEIPTRSKPWPEFKEPRRAAASSFGAGGTNAHVILQEAPTATLAEHQRKFHCVLITAKSKAALRDRAQAMLSTIDQHSLASISHSSLFRQFHWPHRLLISAPDHATLKEGLQSFHSTGEAAYAFYNEGKVLDQPRVVFVFPGQGGQWAGMARRLYENSPVFKEQFLACAAAIERAAGWDLLAALRLDDFMQDISRLQPIIWAIQVSLAKVFEHFEIVPDLVVGHSMGEVAAAVAAGKLSLADGAKVICTRSRLMAQLKGRGLMLFSALTEDKARAWLKRFPEVSLAAINGLESLVFSGESAAVMSLSEALSSENIFNRLVKVDVASHSAEVDPILPELMAQLGSIRTLASPRPMASTVHGQPLGETALDAAYWAKNLRETVRFSPLIQKLMDQDNLFIEISPHPVLMDSILEHGEDSLARNLALCALQRDAEEDRYLLRSIAASRISQRQATMDRIGEKNGWFQFCPPAHPYQSKSYWLEKAKRPTRPALVAVLDTVKPEPQTLRSAPDEAGLQNFVDRTLRGITGLDANDELDRELGFFQMGMTSKMLLEFLLRINAEFDVDLKMPQLFKYNSPLLLTRYLLENLGPGIPEESGDDEILSQLESLLATL